MNVIQDTYDNLRTRWLNTEDDRQALDYLKQISDYKRTHPEVIDKKVPFI